MSDNRTTISMNNNGASLISSGRPRDAIPQLANALKQSKILMQESSTVRHDAAIHSSEPVLDSWMLQDCTFARNNASDAFVYSHPISVPETTRNTLEAHLLMTSTILFNLAIAHQLSGIHQGHDPKLLKKALAFYECSFKLSEAYRCNHTSSCIYYTMALMNNLGICHRSLNHGESAEKMFSSLLTYLMYVLTSPHKFLETNFEAFYANVSHLAFPTSMRTAPAA